MTGISFGARKVRVLNFVVAAASEKAPCAANLRSPERPSRRTA